MGSPQNLPSNGGNARLPPNPKGKKRKQRHSTLNFASNDTDTELSPDSNSCKRRRGSTFLPDVIKDRSSGVRREVHYNKRGPTIGETKPKYSSWLGVLARTMVPIDRKWKEVTNETKNKLWECVQMSFKVDPRSKKKVLSNIATSCRTFRKALTAYIREHKSDPDVLARPPPNYSFLDQNQWDAFVKHRLTKDFQLNMKKKSIEGAEGDGAGDEGAKDEVTKGQDTEDIDRSVLWKLARQNKNGEYDDEGIKEKAARIDEVTQRSREGSLPIGGSNDILALALDKRERSGRVRAAGEFVTPTAYFDMPRRSIHSSCEEKFKTLMRAMSNKESRVNEREQVPQAPHHTPQSELASSNTMKSHNIGNLQFSPVTMEDSMTTQNDMPPDPKSKVKQSQPCRLAVGSLDNIVAMGKMFEKVGPEEVVHKVPLGDANVRVYIDFVIKKGRNSSCAYRGRGVYCWRGNRILASLLQDVENDKLVFVPYNLGVHWILLVIDLSSSTIHYLDSLQPDEIDPNIQLIFGAAMRIYDSSKSNPRKRSLTWMNVKCPRQPTNVECGFYVMRYMKDLIADGSILSKKNFNGKTTYTKAEIDEVRVEWMNCVLEYDI